MSKTSNLAVIKLVIFTSVLLLSLIYIIRHSFSSTKWPSITLLALLYVISSVYQISTNGNANDVIEIIDFVSLFLILLAFAEVLEPL
jgi:hypothetical protein